MKCRLFHYITIVFLLWIFSLCAWATEHNRTLHIHIVGITGDAQKNVVLALQNIRDHLDYPLTSFEILRFRDQAPKVIQNALAPYGFFQSQVKSTLITSRDGWTTLFSITPGAPVRIASVVITIQGQGKTDPAFQMWLSKKTLKPGDILLTQQYENIKTDLYNLATQRGYFNATMKRSNIVIDLKNNLASIMIVYDTGPRYRFGETTFSKTPFHARFLKRFLQYQPGEYYSAAKIEETQSGMVASQFFNQVLIKPVPKEAKNNVVPISIFLLPRKAKEYTVGAGYGTDTGIRGTVGMTLRNLNGSGHRFQTFLRGSEDNSSFVTKYLIPGKNPGRDLFGLNASISNINQVTGHGQSFQAGPDYTMTVGRWKDTFGLTYLKERYNIVTLPQTSTQLVFPTTIFRYVYVDKPTQPHNGVHFQTQLTGASQDVLSETNFFQIITSFKTLYTFQKTHTRFLFRTKLGHTNINNLGQLPLSLQLFAGGAESVRGYSYNALGPGRNLIVGSAEIQQRVKGDWYLTGFVDAGVVRNKQLLQNLNVGVGPGFAWVSSIGILELTVANAITTPTKPWVIQFTMGTVL